MDQVKKTLSLDNKLEHFCDIFSMLASSKKELLFFFGDRRTTLCVYVTFCTQRRQNTYVFIISHSQTCYCCCCCCFCHSCPYGGWQSNRLIETYAFVYVSVCVCVFAWLYGCVDLRVSTNKPYSIHTTFSVRRKIWGCLRCGILEASWIIAASFHIPILKSMDSFFLLRGPRLGLNHWLFNIELKIICVFIFSVNSDWIL